MVFAWQQTPYRAGAIKIATGSGERHAAAEPDRAQRPPHPRGRGPGHPGRRAGLPHRRLRDQHAHRPDGLPRHQPRHRAARHPRGRRRRPGEGRHRARLRRAERGPAARDPRPRRRTSSSTTSASRGGSTPSRSSTSAMANAFVGLDQGGLHQPARALLRPLVLQPAFRRHGVGPAARQRARRPRLHVDLVHPAPQEQGRDRRADRRHHPGQRRAASSPSRSEEHRGTVSRHGSSCWSKTSTRNWSSGIRCCASARTARRCGWWARRQTRCTPARSATPRAPT